MNVVDVVDVVDVVLMENIAILVYGGHFLEVQQGQLGEMQGLVNRISDQLGWILAGTVSFWHGRFMDGVNNF